MQKVEITKIIMRRCEYFQTSPHCYETGKYHSNRQIDFDQIVQRKCCHWVKRAKVGKKLEFVDANEIIRSKHCGISKRWPTMEMQSNPSD